VRRLAGRQSVFPGVLATSQIEGRCGTGQDSAKPITCDAEGGLDAWSGGRRLACEEGGAVTFPATPATGEPEDGAPAPGKGVAGPEARGPRSSPALGRPSSGRLRTVSSRGRPDPGQQRLAAHQGRE
jgi:hypothetical protein